MSTSSDYVRTVDVAFIFIVAVSVLVLLGVTATMIYFVIKYNRKRHPKAEQIEGHLLLEIVWVVVPTLLVLAMFYAGYSSFKVLRNVPKESLKVKVTGQMWKWSFHYPNGKQYDTLYVPVGKAVKLEMKSLDVNHSFYIPAFRIKEDVIAGKENYLVFTADKTGSYEIACAEYCGMRHSYMYNTLHVIPQGDFDRWVAKK